MADPMKRATVKECFQHIRTAYCFEVDTRAGRNLAWDDDEYVLSVDKE
jgi:hypothetical protein